MYQTFENKPEDFKVIKQMLYEYENIRFNFAGVESIPVIITIMGNFYSLHDIEGNDKGHTWVSIARRGSYHFNLEARGNDSFIKISNEYVNRKLNIHKDTAKGITDLLNFLVGWREDKPSKKAPSMKRVCEAIAFSLRKDKINEVSEEVASSSRNKSMGLDDDFTRP